MLLVRDRLLAPSDPAALRADLIAKIEESATVWLDLDDLWGRLETGETVLCGAEEVAHPYFIAWRNADRAAHPDLAALADDINLLISDLHQAADVWTAVCQGGAVEIAPATAAEARAALDRAADRLTTYQAALGLPTPG